MLLLSMVFCHLIADFLIQGVLSQMKQRDWWKRQSGYSGFYKYDYIISLLAHSFEWAFSIMLPVYLVEGSSVVYYVLFVLNVIIHAIIDDLKANKLKLNLVQDQLYHIVQIVVTWAVLVY